MRSSMPDSRKTMGLAEAGVRLRLPYQSVHRLLLIGKIRGEKIGSRWAIRVEDVERLVRDREQGNAITMLGT